MKDEKDGSDSVWMRSNHSFDPNCCVTPQVATETVVWTAEKDIFPDDMLTFDYTTTEESVLASPFVDFDTGIAVGFSCQSKTLNC
jgi:SET domain-containing protein